MKIVSISFRRSDLLRLQRAAWNKYAPDAEFVVAAHHDHELDVGPDIEVEYDDDPEYTLWPNNYLGAAEQVLGMYDEDIVVVEGDIFPIKPFDMASMFNPGTIRRYGVNYPGLLFMPKERMAYDDLDYLDWKLISNDDGILPFEITDDMRLELIGEHFLHYNGGDTKFRSIPHVDPKTAIMKNLYDMFGIGDQYAAVAPQAAPVRKATVTRKPIVPSNIDIKRRMNTCRKCDYINGNRCMTLRRKSGCSTCSTPWESAYIKCPLKLWPKVGTTIALDDQAIAIVAAYATGRTLELGTGDRNGTEAALNNASHVVTVDHMPVFSNEACDIYADDDRVTVRNCAIEENSYVLPDNIGTFNTIIVDGPPGTAARDVTLGKVIPMLAPNGIVIMDDAYRDETVINKWADHYGMTVSTFETDKGVAILSYD